MIETISQINAFILGFFIVLATSYLVVLIGAIPDTIRAFRVNAYIKEHHLIRQDQFPPITAITPMYNDGERTSEAIKSVLQSKFKNLYAIAVNDGSTDDSMQILIRNFDLVEIPIIVNERIGSAAIRKVYTSRQHRNLLVIDKEHHGAGDSINAGLNACFTPYFMTFDGDSIIDDKAISNLMYDILTQKDITAVGGGVYLLNNCKTMAGKMLQPRAPYGYITGLQINEYLRSHLFNRTGWNMFGGTMGYSGTATLFSKQAVITANGFDRDNFAQDCEIVMRLHTTAKHISKPCNIRFNPAAIIWTDVPDTLKSFTRQRINWQRGLLRSTLRYWYMFLNPKYKRQGFIGYPVFFIQEILAPFVEFTAYIMAIISYALGIINITSLLLFIALAWGFAVLLNVASMFINLQTFNSYQKSRDIFWIIATSTMEMFGFRQYLVGVKVYASIQYFFNRLRGKPL